MRIGQSVGRLLALSLLFGGGFFPVFTNVSAQESASVCGEFHRVQRGDTLRALTVRTYGHDRFFELFEANRDILSDPAEIEVGQLLFLPCTSDGNVTRQQALQRLGRKPSTVDQLGTRLARRTERTDAVQVAVVSPGAQETLPKPGARGIRASANSARAVTGAPAAELATPPPQTAPAEKPPKGLRMLSSNGLSPLSGEALPDGGLIGSVIREAFAQSTPFTKTDTVFVDDRAAHLEVLLPMQAFALSYPWPAPDCTLAGAVGAHSRAICGEFELSLPIYQIEMIFLARPQAPELGVSSVGELKTGKICRPEGFPPVDLERLGLGAFVLIKRSVSDCIAAVLDGEANVLSTPRATYNALRWSPALEEISALRRNEPVHAIFPRSAPLTASLKAKLDQGLRSLQASGKWFRIVSGYLSDFNRGRLSAKN